MIGPLGQQPTNQQGDSPTNKVIPLEHPPEEAYNTTNNQGALPAAPPGMPPGFPARPPGMPGMVPPGRG